MLFRSDRKSTRLNSSHTIISYAVFCLKKNTHKGRATPTLGAPRPARTTPAAPPHSGGRAVARSARTGVARTYRAPSDLFFFNDTATTEIYTLSLHDALPI